MTELRNVRLRPVGPSSVLCQRLSNRARAAFGEGLPLDHGRPKTRGDCESVERPCIYVGCRFNLYLDVRRNGNLKMNFPDIDPTEMEESCALDVADRGWHSPLRIAPLMNVTREAVRQIEQAALAEFGQRIIE